MKFILKSTITFFLLIILFICNNTLFAQSNFEGKIVYTISYTDLPEEMKGYESMLPKDMTITMKGNKSRVEQSQMMGKNIIVSDMDNKNGFIEMDMGGQKFRVNISTEEFKQEEESIPSNAEYLEGSKMILGYDCKKAIIKDESGNTVMTVFYTDKIINKAQKEFVGLNGFPLEYNMTQQKMSIKMSASEITEQTVPDETFNKSEGYKDISQEDLQKMMMGGGN